MTVPPETSRRIALLRFPLCLGPVVVHMRYVLPNGPWRMFLCGTFAHAVVPLFFVFSGYLFFTAFRPTLPGYLSQLRSRANTILVPYLFWSVLTVLLFAAKSLLLASRGGASDPFADLTVGEVVTMLTGLSSQGNDVPLNSPLWYLRDLMVHCALAPVYAWLIRRLPHLTLLVLGGLFGLLVAKVQVLPGNIFTWFTLEGMFFFPLGIYLVGREPATDRWVRRVGWWAVAVWLGASVVKAFWHPFGPADVYDDAMNCLIIPSGVVAVWFLAGRWCGKGGGASRLARWGRFSFLIYVWHIIPIKIGMVVLGSGLGLSGPAARGLVPLCVLGAIFGGGIGVFLLLERCCPRVLGLVTGRRGAGRSSASRQGGPPDPPRA